MQPIHPFPARMAPETVSCWLAELPKNAVVLDPMCGSGVVLRQSVQMGLLALGIDVDPLAVLMSKVWTRSGSHADLVSAADGVLAIAKRRRAGVASVSAASRCVETRAFIEYWFSSPQRNQLARLSIVIEENELNLPRWMLNALSICLSRTIITKQAGASLAWDVSHSRPHRKREVNDFDVFHAFFLAAKRLTHLLDARPLRISAKVRSGDCRNLNSVKSQSIDAIVTSPPYLNAIDYLRGHKLALVWLGYTIPELRLIRSESVGCERSASRGEVSAKILAGINKIVPQLSSLPTRQRAIVLKYALDSELMMLEMRRVLKSNGKIVLVLADSTVRGIEIKSSEIFALMASHAGLKLKAKDTREIPSNRRYLPINSTTSALQNRMKVETIQVFEGLH